MIVPGCAVLVNSVCGKRHRVGKLQNQSQNMTSFKGHKKLKGQKLTERTRSKLITKVVKTCNQEDVTSPPVTCGTADNLFLPSSGREQKS